MVKISRDRFRKYKNNIKFLEFYWSEYKHITPKYRKYKYAKYIRRFIKHQKYEQIRQAKYNRLSNTFSLTDKQYDDLIKFNSITRDLKQKLTKQSS